MLKIENVVLPSPKQWDAIIRGTRNPKNSWARMDSYGTHVEDPETLETADYEFYIGPNDQKLLEGLAAGGPVHAKYRRMIPVYLDITAPLYWWKEFDTYKLGTVANSCSTMHKIHAKEFTMEDFSTDHLMKMTDPDNDFPADFPMYDKEWWDPDLIMQIIIKALNFYRQKFLNYNELIKLASDSDEVKRLKNTQKKYWWQMIQLLPSSYNQKRTVMLNYEVLVNIYRWRRDHKLDEWHTFCDWIETLPYAELITGKPAEVKSAPVVSPLPTNVPNGIVRTQDEIERDRKDRMEEIGMISK